MSSTELNAIREKMQKTISSLKEELASIRAGRANPVLLDRVTVSYYGAETPLKQLANISVPEPRLLQINPYDQSAISDIEKGIQKANLGLTPTNDGKTIRITMPVLTEERRIELTKMVKSHGENAKISIRNIRRDAIDSLKKSQKASEITEDDLKQGEKDIQQITDDITKTIDQIISKKEAEILEV